MERTQTGAGGKLRRSSGELEEDGGDARSSGVLVG